MKPQRLSPEHQDGQTTFQMHAATGHNSPFINQLDLTFTHGPEKLDWRPCGAEWHTNKLKQSKGCCYSCIYNKPIKHLLTATHAEKSLQWDEQSSQAFLTIKQAIADISLLAHPHHDTPTNIMMDTSDIAVAAVLQQKVDD